MALYTPPPFNSLSSSEVPLYGQVMQWLLQIIEQDFDHEERFFTERELMEKLKVSQPTVRRAMQELVNRGKLRRHVGRGTFVQKFASTRLVGIIAPQYQSPILMQQINAFAELGAPFDCNLRVHNTREGEPVREMARALKANPYEERLVLLGHSQEDAWTLFDELEHRGFRSICALPFSSGYPGNSVCVDPGAGVHIALDYLEKMGHKRIAFIINEPVDLAYIRIRLDSLRAEIKRRGLKKCVLIECDTPQWTSSFQAAFDAMERALALSPQPTAIVPLSGIGAWAALRYAGKNRISVPDAFSVFAFDNLPGSELLYPALTGLSVDWKDFAKRTLEVLWSESTEPVQIVIKPQLLERESVITASKK